MKDGAQRIGWKEREYLAYREAILLEIFSGRVQQMERRRWND